MLVTFRKKLGLSIADIYFLNNEKIEFEKQPDIIFYVQRRTSTKNTTNFYTLHSNLSEDEEILFSKIRRTVKKDIMKVENFDHIKYYFYKPSMEDIIEFSKYHKIVSKKKSIGKCSISRLKALAKVNGLVFSKIIGENEETLCFHVYIVDEVRARHLYSVSFFREFDDPTFRTMVARVHKYLYWKDMMNFKKEGLLIYDFGGIVLSEEEGTELQNITYFKKAFRGEVVQEFNLVEGISAKGKIAVKFYNLINAFKM